MTNRTNMLARAAASRPGRIMVLAALLVALVLPAAAADQGVPARPEQLKFPPLSYTPPAAKDYRVTLKNGMVAYPCPTARCLWSACTC